MSLITRYILIAICLQTWALSMGQSKEDLIGVLKAVSEVSELEPAYQVDLSEGPAMVLRKRDNVGVNPNELEHNLFFLTSDDLWGFDRIVRIMTIDEANYKGVPGTKLMEMRLSFAEDNCNLILSGNVEDGNKYMQASISLLRDGFDWVVKGKNINIR